MQGSMCSLAAAPVRWRASLRGWVGPTRKCCSCSSSCPAGIMPLPLPPPPSQHAHPCPPTQSIYAKPSPLGPQACALQPMDVIKTRLQLDAQGAHRA